MKNIMDELEHRDWQHTTALLQADLFPVRESWVTYFYARVYAAIKVNPLIILRWSCKEF